LVIFLYALWWRHSPVRYQEEAYYLVHIKGGNPEMKTYTAKPQDVQRKWYVVDAEGQTLGRLASQVAMILRGKHRPTYTPHVDTGDHVIIINAEKIHLTGKKLQNKKYYRHSGYPGGIKSVTAGDLLDRHPERVIKAAVWGMIPHNTLGRQIIKKLKIYAGAEHPHQAQMPETLELKY
jgi:large subunit ribosomal protein L13